MSVNNFLEAAPPPHCLVKFFQGFSFFFHCSLNGQKRISARCTRSFVSLSEKERRTSLLCFWQQQQQLCCVVWMELLAKRIDMYFYFFYFFFLILESVGRDANNLAESRPRAPALRCSRTPPKMRGKNKQFSLVVNMRKMLGTWKEKEQQCVSE